MTGIQLSMSSTGSIAGRVFDNDGEPVGKAQVAALRPVYQDGQRRLTVVQSVQTNDRGEYRLFWLAPGSYYVSAKPEIFEMPGDFRPVQNSITPMSMPAEHVTPPARFGTYEQASTAVIHKRTLKSGEIVEETYVPTYYPGVLESASATAIPLGAGATVTGIDISVATSAVPSYHIQGRIINFANATGRVSLSAGPVTSEPFVSLPTAVLDTTGSFDIAGALPGRYYIFANSDSAQGRAVVDVGAANQQNITITMISSFSLTGKFTLEGQPRSGKEPQIGDLRVAPFVHEPSLYGIASTLGRWFTPPPNADGSFEINGAMIGDFRVPIRGVPKDAYVKSIRMGGVDVLDGGLHLTKPPDTPLEIVIGLNAGQVTGSVVGARQEPLSNRTVVLVPDVRLRHRSDLYMKVTTDAAGRFSLRGITPGGYQLFAWENVESGAWQDPEFIRAYEGRGKTIQVREGSDENVQLPVIP
jgi:hypothetical protein